jgi:hypothetical protein
MKFTIANNGGLVVILAALTLSLPVYAAFTDKKPDSTPKKSENITCKNLTFGSCYKESVNICQCVRCPGLEENLPNCDCTDETGSAYYESWTGTCDRGVIFYGCTWPSEPNGGGEREDQKLCGRDQS